MVVGSVPEHSAMPNLWQGINMFLLWIQLFTQDGN